MGQKQEDSQDSERSGASDRLVLAETLRSTSQPIAGIKKEDPEEKGEHMSLFWRVFGGTILSISSLIVITLYNNLSEGIANLRTEVNNERTAREDLVKKEDFNSRSTNIYDRLRAFDNQKVELEGLRERVAANAAAVDGMKKDTSACVEGLKKDVATAVDAIKKDSSVTADQVKKDELSFDLLKERVAAIEALKGDVAGIALLKERMTAAAADVKSLSAEVAKLSQEVDRNHSSELERKSSQDVQFKQVEETLKEVQKGLQDCREKLARLEGALPTAPPAKATKPQ